MHEHARYTRHATGTLQRSPVLAAAALAYVEAGYNMGPLHAIKQRKPRRSPEVCCTIKPCCSCRAAITSALCVAGGGKGEGGGQAGPRETAGGEDGEGSSARAQGGINKHKRGPSTAGAPLAALAWEPVVLGELPSASPTAAIEPC
eukprot:2755498-Prymnesium_polylepis.2